MWKPKPVRIADPDAAPYLKRTKLAIYSTLTFLILLVVVGVGVFTAAAVVHAFIASFNLLHYQIPEFVRHGEVWAVVVIVLAVLAFTIIAPLKDLWENIFSKQEGDEEETHLKDAVKETLSDPLNSTQFSENLASHGEKPAHNEGAPGPSEPQSPSAKQAIMKGANDSKGNRARRKRR